jgi:hypothetical protein
MLAAENAPVGLAELGKFRLFRKKKKKSPAPPPPAPDATSAVPVPGVPGSPGIPGAPGTPEGEAASSKILQEALKSPPKGGSIFVSTTGTPNYLLWGLIGGGALIVIGVGLFLILRK